MDLVRYGVDTIIVYSFGAIQQRVRWKMEN